MVLTEAWCPFIKTIDDKKSLRLRVLFVKFVENTHITALFSLISAGLWSVMTLGMSNKPEKKEEEFQETLLANQSLLFLLVLANHCTSERGVANPYREALFSFTNIHGQCFICS